MWRRKKFIVLGLLATLVLVGTIGGVAFARMVNVDDSQLKTLLTSDNVSQPKTLLARVAAILGIDQQKVESAFTQAQSEMREEALDNYLKNLVDQGKITQQQADQYKAWWQAKPDMEPFKQQLKEWQQARPGMPPELKEWQEARPNIPLPGAFRRFGGHGMRGGMMGGGGRY